MRRYSVTVGFAAIGLCLIPVLRGADEVPQKIEVSKTENLEFAANGALRLQNSVGELTVEGWDRPGVEITTIRSTKDVFAPQDRARVLHELDRVIVTVTRRGSDIVIATQYPRRKIFRSPKLAVPFLLEYRIRVPRNARLFVTHGQGEVHVDELAGNVDVTAQQGLITLHLAGEGPRVISASSSYGTVNSDFPGSEKRYHFHLGHRFTEAASAPAQNLSLRIGYGDIVILRANRPPTPPADLRTADGQPGKVQQ